MKRGREVKNFSCRFPKPIFEKLRYIARHDCRSVSSMVWVMVREQILVFERENGEIKL